MTPEIECVFAHLLDPSCRLRAADRRVELERLRAMVREALDVSMYFNVTAWGRTETLVVKPGAIVSVSQYGTFVTPRANDRSMRVPGGASI